MVINVKFVNLKCLYLLFVFLVSLYFVLKWIFLIGQSVKVNVYPEVLHSAARQNDVMVCLAMLFGAKNYPIRARAPGCLRI